MRDWKGGHPPLDTSVHSARVGRGFLIMLSSIWVATMTGLPAGGIHLGWIEGGHDQSGLAYVGR